MRLLRKAIPYTAAITLAAAGPAAAALSSSQATQASAQAARAVAKQTHASSFKVTRCARIGSTKTGETKTSAGRSKPTDKRYRFIVQFASLRSITIQIRWSLDLAFLPA